MDWTEERVEELRRYWSDGKTAAQIAELIPGTTRNGIIGKAHRIGLRARPSPILRGRPSDAEETTSPLVPSANTRAPHRTAAKGRPSALIPVSPPEPRRCTSVLLNDGDHRRHLHDLDTNETGVLLAELGNGQCRGATGTRDGIALFCGKPVVGGRLYCDHHDQKYHIPKPEGYSAASADRQAKYYAFLYG